MRDLRGQLAGTERYTLRRLGAIKNIIIHHSAVDADSSSESIADYHVNTNGWPGIGYHFVIRENGDIEYCGDLSTVRYHATIRNGDSVGICLVGNFTDHHPTELQLGATQNLIRVLMPVLDPDEDGSVRVSGHRDVQAGTSCPGDTWADWQWIFGEWMG